MYIYTPQLTNMANLGVRQQYQFNISNTKGFYTKRHQYNIFATAKTF